jgi:hypothetical protein
MVLYILLFVVALKRRKDFLDLYAPPPIESAEDEEIENMLHNPRKDSGSNSFMNIRNPSQQNSELSDRDDRTFSDFLNSFGKSSFSTPLITSPIRKKTSSFVEIVTEGEQGQAEDEMTPVRSMSVA